MEPISLTVAAVTLAITAISGIIDFVGLRKELKSCAVNTLEINIQNGWNVLKILGEYQLQGNEISEVQDVAIKALTQWCYVAEDLLEKKKIKKKFLLEFISIKGIWKKLTKPDEILAAFNNIKEMLTALKDEIERSNTNPNLSNGTYGESKLDKLIGRDTDVHRIIEVLVSCQERGSNGISIVGMSGIGKTLLARTILEDLKSGNQFNRISWVKAKDGKFVWDDMEKEITKHQVSTSSQNNKFLVLIENLQNMELLQWDNFLKFKEHEPSMAVTIMVTTRNPKISKITGTSLYNLGTLTVKCCVDVIKKNARPLTSDHLDQEEEKLKRVAEKCEGLPLAAKMCGLMIGTFKNDNDWDEFMKVRNLSQVSWFKKEIFPALVSSSYKDLESELWRCVAYLSLFPSGHQFDLEDLVHLWVGECFFRFQDKSSLKEIRNKYIDDLKQRSIIVESSDQNSNKIYMLHSLGEDIALSASSETCLRITKDEGDVRLRDKNIRHLSLFFNPTILAEVETKSNLRTFLSLHDEINSGQPEEIRDELYSAISRVRVLSLKGTKITKLRSLIGKLKYLRYLNVSFTRVENLPKEVGNLGALQFLKLKGTNISSLPKGFHKLTNLVYVDWDESYLRRLQGLRKIGSLSRLENLPLFKAGDKKGYMVSELKEMNKLQGSLHIQDLEMVKDTNVANQAMLHKKDELTKVVLEWCANSEQAEGANSEQAEGANSEQAEGVLTSLKPHANSEQAESVLTSLKPHANVKELKLKNCPAKGFPDWIRDSSVEKIHLFACRFCSFFPVLGILKNLKTLVLENMSSKDVSSRVPDDDADMLFLKLESLELYNIAELQSMTGLRAKDMPLLKDLTVGGATHGLPGFLNEIKSRQHINYHEI